MNFNQIYLQLNPAQRQAVDQIDGPVMVIAGPGTGKTQVLSARIANILQKTDTNPNSILALTFTEVAAINMKQRLFEMIGSTAYQVRIMTFHGFCNEVILSHPEYFNIREEAEPISDLEMIEFLREYFSNPQLEFLRTPKSSDHNIHAAKSAVLNIKKEGLSVLEFKQLVGQENDQLKTEKEDLSPTKLKAAEKRLGQMQELADLYGAYQQYLADKNRYDYEDMILWVMSEFEHNHLLLTEYQEQLLYFLVDEYQDTNSAQNKILDLLANFWGEQANVFVVGDPNQTIYRFQGASLENVLGFVKRYTQVKIVTLEQGYRCSQQIYDAAARIISQQKVDYHGAVELLGVLAKPLQSVFQDQQISFLEAQTNCVEEVSVVKKVEELIKSGVSPEQIAILFKKNLEIFAFIEVLKKWQIAYQLEKDENILTSEFIRQLLVLMQVILDIRSSDSVPNLYELLLFDWIDVDKTTVIKLLHLASAAKKSLYQHLEQLDSDAIKQTNLDQEKVEQILEFVKTIKELMTKDLNMTFLEWFPEMIRLVCLDKWLVNHSQKYQWLQELNAFYSEVKSLSISDKNLKLERCLAVVSAMIDQNLPISVKVMLGSKKGVVLSTAHGAKGKEWQYVFIPHLSDKNWGNAKSPNQLPLPKDILRFQPETKEDKNADDRRLFYVSLTRAQKRIYLSYSKLDEQKDKKQNMSMFVGELTEGENLLEADSFEVDQTSLVNLTAQYVLPHQVLPDDTAFMDWLKSVVKDFRLSPTALDSYLKSPEDFLFNNILRIPRAKTASLAFGSAVHATLEYTIRWWQKNQKLLDQKQILEFFENALQKEVLTKEDFEARLKLGKDVLASYFANFDPHLHPLKIEYHFGGTGKDIILDDNIYLTGKLDRVDLMDEKEKIVKVIDYKTGKVKSIAEIQATAYLSQLSEREKTLPESIRGSLKRQLLFYKLLSQLDSTFKYTVSYGELDFVESYQQKGKSGKVVMELLDEDVTDLKELIRQVISEIRELKFFTPNI